MPLNQHNPSLSRVSFFNISSKTRSSQRGKVNTDSERVQILSSRSSVELLAHDGVCWLGFHFDLSN